MGTGARFIAIWGLFLVSVICFGAKPSTPSCPPTSVLLILGRLEIESVDAAKDLVDGRIQPLHTGTEFTVKKPNSCQ